MTTKTLAQHMDGIKQRLDRKESDLELNIFVEEIERARNVTIDTVRDELPKTVTEPYGDVRFSTEYDNPPGYEQWLEMRREGFTGQPIQNMARIPTGNWGIHDLAPIVHWTRRPRTSSGILELPYKNMYFGKTFRVNNEDNASFCLGIPSLNDVTRLVFGFTREDLKLAESRGINADDYSYYAYVVGTAFNSERELTQEELEKCSRVPIFKHVFRMKPPYDYEIKQELLQIHGLTASSADYRIMWTTPEKLSYPMPRGVLYTYKDAKESGIFEELEFGLLEERRRVIDPVLAGKFNGFRVPLCYWK